VYYYDSKFSPSVHSVDFADRDCGPASGMRKLPRDGEPDRGGNQPREFRPAGPFRFLRDK
jgi:hypothetical protein